MRSEIVVAGENKETAGIEPSSVSMTIMSMGSVHHHHHHLHHQDESTINSCSQRTAVIQQPQQLLLQPNPFASPPPPPPAPVAQSSQHQDQHQQQQRGQFREPELNIGLNSVLFDQSLFPFYFVHERGIWPKNLVLFYFVVIESVSDRIEGLF